MLTKITEGSREIDPEITILDSSGLRHGYTSQFFFEIGVTIKEEVRPLFETPSWLLDGDLYGLSVQALYNPFEDLVFTICSAQISYDGSMKDTFNHFIKAYREAWHEQNNETQALRTILFC